MRVLLKGRLDELDGVGRTQGLESRWKHLTSQCGMFCYSGLSPAQVLKLRTEHHVYCTDDGRMSMAGVNSANVEYLANAIFKVQN